MSARLSDDEIFSRVKNLMEDEFDLNCVELNLSTKLKDDLGLDSLDYVVLTMALESDFECDISDVEADSLETVQDVVNLLKNVQE